MSCQTEEVRNQVRFPERASKYRGPGAGVCVNPSSHCGVLKRMGSDRSLGGTPLLASLEIGLGDVIHLLDICCVLKMGVGGRGTLTAAAVWSGSPVSAC